MHRERVDTSLDGFDERLVEAVQRIVHPDRPEESLVGGDVVVGCHANVKPVGPADGDRGPTACIAGLGEGVQERVGRGVVALAGRAEDA